MREQNEKEKNKDEKEENEKKGEVKEVSEQHVDKLKKEKEKKDENIEKAKEEKGSKKRGRGKTMEKIKDKTKEVEQKKEPEPRTPASDRPVRERKSVERLVASIEKEAAKEFHIAKGQGTPLKDIPNVAFKLSRRKMGDTIKLLHPILFGRRGKAVQIKSNILRFSGFVWHDNQEKQKTKVREKLDKYNKEILLEFCDMFDIQITKATTWKEDVITSIIDFLVEPHATSTGILSEKEMSSKGSKRKRATGGSSSTPGGTTRKRTAKSRKKNVDASKEVEENATGSEDESEEDEENIKKNVNGVPEKSGNQMSEDSGSEGKCESTDESDEEMEKPKRNSKTSLGKKQAAGKAKSKRSTVSTTSSPPSKETLKKSSSKRSKVDDDNDTSPRVFSRKKKHEKAAKASILTKFVTKEMSGNKVAKGKEKNKEVKSGPSDGELRDSICEIFKKVDFNTATVTDILKKLARQFDTDLTPRKSSMKLMIQEELTKLTDEDGDINADKDENQSAEQGVEA